MAAPALNLPETSPEVLALLDSQPSDEQALALVRTALQEVRPYHDDLCRTWDNRYRSYRGYLERKEALKWMSKQHPPFAFQLIETIVANMMEDDLELTLQALPKLDSPAELERLHNAVYAAELRLQAAQQACEFSEQQRAFALQASICGVTAGKTFWNFEERAVKHRLLGEHPIYHSELSYQYGRPVTVGTVTTEHQVEQMEVVYDDPVFEVKNVRDLFWPESATSVETAPWIIDCVWMTPRDVQDFIDDGTWEPRYDGDFNPYSFISSMPAHSSGQEENALFNRDRTRGLVPVYEYWTEDWLIVAIGEGDGAVLVRNEENPYWHRYLKTRKPFVIASTAPDLFTIPGISDVELVEDLQTLQWTLINQRVDNLQLMNNLITVFSGDIDPDDFEFYPGAQWFLPPGMPVQEAVQQLQVNPIPAQLSIPAEDRLMQQMETVTGGTGSTNQVNEQVNAQTATQATLASSVAERRLLAKKGHLMKALAKASEQMLSLCQQFDDLQSPRLVGKVGNLGMPQYEPVMAGDYANFRFDLRVAMAGESLVRQQRRAEAIQKLNMVSQMAGPMAMSGHPLDLKPAFEDFLREFGDKNPERYYLPAGAPNPMMRPNTKVVLSGSLSQDQEMQAAAMQGMQPPQPQVPAGAPGNGVTNPDAAAGPLAPSNENSISPVAAAQQAGALGGGMNNQ